MNFGSYANLTALVNKIADKFHSYPRWSEFSTSVKKNLLMNGESTQTIRGVTFTKNADGSVTCNGTQDGQGGGSYFHITDYLYGNGNYILNGCPADGSSSTYRLYVWDNDDHVEIGSDIGNGASIALVSGHRYTVNIMIGTGQTVSNLTFYPMIRLATIEDDTYVPYIPDNTELVSYKDNAILGAKNLLPNNAVSQTVNGVTFTVNDDGTFVASGTHTQSTAQSFTIYSKSNSNLVVGKTYKLSNGLTSSLTNCNLVLQLFNSSDTRLLEVNCPSGVVDFTVPSGTTKMSVALWFKSTAFGTSTFKPMLRLATDTDDTYVPYAKTNKELTDSHKVTTKQVDTTGWTSDTTSQSGTTLYKKSISLSHVYVDSPTVDIGAASGSVLPTTAQQEAYDLIQYVTVDTAIPCLYLYASDIPTDGFYINVGGVD